MKSIIECASIGGGDISDDGLRLDKKKVYPHSKMNTIMAWCKENGTTFWEYVQMYEDNDLYY